MYGSIHTHFESPYDTANNLKDALEEFHQAGAKKVAVTEHDVFSSFEDLKDIVNKRGHDIEVVPGVEATLTDDINDFHIEKAHCILIAKDEEGFHSLSRIITRANENYHDHPEYGRPIITFDILRDEVRKGHVLYSSACIQGIFAQILGDEKIRNQGKIEEYKKRIFLSDEEQDAVIAKEVMYAKQKENKTFDSANTDDYKQNHRLYQMIDRNLSHIHELESMPTRSYMSKELLAKEAYKTLCEIFGKENVWFELQNHGMEREKDVYRATARLAKKVGGRIVASNDIHVTKRHPTEADFIRRNVAQFERYATVFDISDADRQLYIKDDDVLEEAVAEITDEATSKEAVSNIKVLLDECQTDYLYHRDANHYPKFCDNENQLFEELIEKGKQEKFPDGFPDKSYDERLKHEIDIIENMGYAGYHLIVQEYLTWTKKYGWYIDWCKENHVTPIELPTMEELDHEIEANHIPKNGLNTGPGRGSGVGALSCYLLGISDVDPMKYDLLFERFLNPQRKSMPDIDADFRTDLRDKAIEHCAQKYGKHSTCKIITKAYGQLKGNLRLLARYVGTRDYEALPKKDQFSTKKDACLKKYQKIGNALARMVETDKDTKKDFIPDASINAMKPLEREIYDLAVNCIGIFTQYGQHAGGDIISGDDVTEYMPQYWNTTKQNYSTQCTFAQAEGLGFLKMDFLGLTNLDIITDMMKATGDYSLLDYKKRDAILNDPAVYRVFATANTQGVFQFESPGMKNFLKQFQPTCMEDIILAVAVYRPGPMQFLDSIVEQKKYERGELKEKPQAAWLGLCEPLDKILAPTYGSIVYQEQVMRIFQDLAGFSLGRADLVRRAMSKKHKEEIDAEREPFLYGDPSDHVEGCVKKLGLFKKGMSEEEKQAVVKPYSELFEAMQKFASYAFNKSHAAAYALVSVFTAYFKAKYPGVFYQVSLSYTASASEIAPYACEMKQAGFRFAPPDFEHSKTDFWYDQDKTIYYGYGRIKDVPGSLTVNNGRYVSMREFCEANPALTASNLTKMAKAGMFDRFGNPKQVMHWINEMPKRIQQAKTIKANKRWSDATKEKRLASLGPVLDVSDYPDEVNAKEKIAMQYEMLGFVFLPWNIERALDKCKPFSASNKTAKEDRDYVGYVLVSYDSTENRVKYSNYKQHKMLLMDKNHEIREFLTPTEPALAYGQIKIHGGRWSLCNYPEPPIRHLPSSHEVQFDAKAVTPFELTNILMTIVGPGADDKIYRIRRGRYDFGAYISGSELQTLNALRDAGKLINHNGKAIAYSVR